MLYNKYRPKSFDAIIGNDLIIDSINNNDIPHSMIFYGERGCGKSSLAHIIASNLSHCYMDIVTASVENGVSKAKDIAQTISQIPLGYSSKMILLDEAHRGSKQFFDALLIAFEDTPKNVYLVIATTEISKIPNTIKSRCAKFHVKIPTKNETYKLIRDICKKENIVYTKKVLDKICLNNNNIPRDCISDLEIIKATDEEDLQLSLLDDEDIKENNKGYDLSRIMLEKGWKDISKLLRTIETNEVEGVRRTVCNYMKSSLLNGFKAKETSLILDSFSKPFEEPLLANLVLACYENV